MTSALLETKFHVPRSRPGAVSRMRLVGALRQGTGGSLTLVSAPPGFGKTSLLAQWLEDSGEQGRARPAVAWLSLDPGDSEPRTYWSYVLSALHRVAPQVGERELSLLQAANAPPLTDLLVTVLNDLAAQPAEVVLVLDDYHAIDSQAVHESMTFLLEHAPPTLRVVIASREDPPLPLARWRARGALIEVRVADLRFTAAEAAAYLNQTMGLPLTSAEVGKLGSRTEGWIAALQLAALSMQKHEDVTGFVDGFSGDDRYVVDYLVEEVLHRQPDHVRTFLLETCILHRLTGALCDEVTGRAGGKATLEALERANLFVVPLDDQRSWYRYHHLFADMLRARVGEDDPARVKDLHRRASAWYERNGERAEAIGHSLAAGDVQRAAELVEREVPASRRHRREALLLSWLERLPDEVVRQRPVLSVAYAGTLLASGAVRGVEQRLLDAERWLATTRSVQPALPTGGPDVTAAATGAELRRVPGWVALYRAALALAVGDPSGTVEHARHALTLLDDADQIAVAAASALLGLASWGRGDLEAAHEAYTTCWSLFREVDHISDVLACAITLADIRITQGRLGQALSIYEKSLLIAGQDRQPGLRGTADMHVGMSEVHRERGDLDQARHFLRISLEHGEHSGLPQNRYRWCVAMAGVHEAEGDLHAAAALLDDAARHYVADFSPDVRPVSALKARVLVKQGRLNEAFAWARERDLAVDDELSYPRELEHLTFARVLIARGSSPLHPQDLPQAERLLTRLLDAAEQGGRAGSVLQVLVLQALAHYVRGDVASAVVPLKRALELAVPEQHARVFLDEGEPMTALLHAAGSTGLLPVHGDRLLQAGAVAAPIEPAPNSPVDAPSQSLSQRERHVLRLLATDLDGPAIARELVVSLSTVRTHTRAIYAKLEVNSRRSAVRRARELDLLRTPRPRP